ncbi:MAG: hypothetical protein PHO37_10515 [Kiritimatiellae bacterium]|nr:hypothetical protein [Kiritimatiellia bacterium]
MPPSHLVTWSRSCRHAKAAPREPQGACQPSATRTEAVGRLAVTAPAGESVVLRESERLTIGHTSITPAVTARGYSAPRAAR